MNPSQENTISGISENVKMRGCGEPLLGSLPSEQGRLEDVAELQPIHQPVVTIDDLEVMAEQLLAKIRILKSYKYPLGIRRGIKQI